MPFFPLVSEGLPAARRSWKPTAHAAESKIKADYREETVLVSAARLWQRKDLETQLSSFSLYLCNPN